MATGTTTRPSTARAAWSWSCRRLCPRSSSPRVRDLAVTAFELGGCAGLARCDFFVEPDGAILVNEINTMPGFTETSVYAKLWAASGLDYPALCDRLVTLAVERHQARPRLRVLSQDSGAASACSRAGARCMITGDHAPALPRPGAASAAA